VARISADVFRWLRIERTEGDRDVLDSISDLLDHLTPERARYVAAFAYLLGRVAGADLQVSDDERVVMERFVAEQGRLTSEEAAAVVRLGIAEGARFGGTHNLQVTREFAAHATPDERMGVLRCLFAVSAADENVTTREDNEVRAVSRELRIEHADFIRARQDVRDHLAVLRVALAPEKPVRGDH
jgi:uncharacterized tellurite resistance protein B-like protein